MKNKVNLITYVDRLAPTGLNQLRDLLLGPLNGIFGGIHILPFYDPIDGSDAGFDPIDHRTVDPRLGTWENVKEIGETLEITTDLIVNHVSAQSKQFKSVLEHGSKSPFSDLFLTESDIFPDGISDKEIKAIYRPRPGTPFTEIKLNDGTIQNFWTTFTKNQIDIKVDSPQGIKYLHSILEKFVQSGVKLIRLDAVGYAIKKAGSSCFMIPETFEFIDRLTQKAHNLGMEILVEIHSYYKDQIAIAAQVDYVYDFALPPLILHAIYTNDGSYLDKWLKICPRNAITVLDTHDGIGVIDIGPHSLDKSKKGLIPDEEIDSLVEEMHLRSNHTSKKATGDAASNLDLYQVNSTYYDSLGQDDQLYLLARAIQFFSPGIPQVYYQGFLAEPNDMKLLTKTGVGRDINRHYFINNELEEALKKPVVKELIQLIKFRNSSDAFDGAFSSEYEGNILKLQWTTDDDQALLTVDFENLEYQID